MRSRFLRGSSQSVRLRIAFECHFGASLMCYAQPLIGYYSTSAGQYQQVAEMHLTAHQCKCADGNNADEQ